jgi:hypothetical protein
MLPCLTLILVSPSVLLAQSCYTGSGEVQYSHEQVWVDNAEDSVALRKALAHAAQDTPVEEPALFAGRASGQEEDQEGMEVDDATE